MDVIAEQSPDNLHSRQLVSGLQQSDFRLFDNDRELPILTFVVGAEHTARPITLWVIVQCNMGLPIGEGSGYMRGKTQWLAPGLAALQPNETVGVAHWCDNGDVKLDLSPTANTKQALSTLEAILKAPPVEGDSDRQGEIALQKLFVDILTATEASSPSRLPVFLFLYGDHSATYATEADTIIKSLLESSGIVFGLTDPGSEANLNENLGTAGQISHIIHHYAALTGGQYFSASRPEFFSPALAYMLTGVHLRYVLGFRPLKLDGKRHTLRVELTKAARKLNANPDLHFRNEYIPTPRLLQP